MGKFQGICEKSQMIYIQNVHTFFQKEGYNILLHSQWNP